MKDRLEITVTAVDEASPALRKLDAELAKRAIKRILRRAWRERFGGFDGEVLEEMLDEAGEVLARAGFRRDRTLAPEGARICRVCGCWDLAACPGGCSWVEPDLCSSCSP